MRNYVQARTSLGAKDTVGVQLAVHATTGKLRVARVRLIAAAPELRERGVVHVVKEGNFGFLRCETRDPREEERPGRVRQQVDLAMGCHAKNAAQMSAPRRSQSEKNEKLSVMFVLASV